MGPFRIGIFLGSVKSGQMYRGKPKPRRFLFFGKEASTRRNRRDTAIITGRKYIDLKPPKKRI